MIQKRSLAVLAVAAAAGAVFPFGLPKGAAAAPLVVSYDSIFLPPQPINQAGMLDPSNPSTNTVTMCAQPLANKHPVAVGATVFLSFFSGLFTAPVKPGGSATVTVNSIGSTAYTATTATDPGAVWATNQFAGDTVTAGTSTGVVANNTATVLTVGSWTTSTPIATTAFSIAASLTTTPEPFLTITSCSYANLDGNDGSVSAAVPITYIGPNPVPVNGRDVVIAADSNADSGSGGTCPASVPCSNGTYVFSPVMSYVFNQTPIATSGTLAAGQTVSLTVTAMDSTSNPVPGAYIDLSLSSAASGGGHATAVNNISGLTRNLNNSPTRFGSTTEGSLLGSLSITYIAATPLPAAGVDIITAQNHPAETVLQPTSYTYGSVTAPVPGPYTAVSPARVCDTRPAGHGITANPCDAPGQGPIGPGAVRAVQITSNGGVPPSGVTAVVLNLTAISPSQGTFLTVYPAGGTRPTTSNVNPAAGAVIATLVEVAVSNLGQIDIFNDLGSVNVAVDVEGYVSPGASTGLYNPLAQPVRVCDTRATGGGIAPNQCNPSGAAPIAGGASRAFNVHTLTDGVPSSGVSAVVFNLTAITPTEATVLTVYPSDVSPPNVSNVNLAAHAVVPNRVVVRVPANGVIDIKNSVGSVNVAVDIDGYFSTSGPIDAEFSGLPPARVCDTRSGNVNDGGCVQATVGSGHVLNLYVAGIYGIPVMAHSGSPVAVVVNITVVGATTGTFVTAYPGPSTAGRPGASDLNLTPGKTSTNLVVVGVGADGTINLFNDLGNINLIVDVLGYYS